MRSLLLLALVLLPVAAPAQVLRTLTAPDSTGSSFGAGLANLGDLDGDGFGDLAVGSAYSSGVSPSGAGRVYVFSGASGGLLLTLASPNEEQNGFFGAGVASAGDLDGDGTPDVLVGATYEARGTRPNGGRAYAFSGATGALLFELAVPDNRSGENVGAALAGLGDVTGDGIPDLAVGDPRAAVPSTAGDLVGAGRVYILSGADGTRVRTLQSPAPVGPDQPGVLFPGRFGTNVVAVGDVTGDGTPDLAVYAPADDVRDPGRPGWVVYLYAGAAGAPVWTAVRPFGGADGPDSNGSLLAAVGDVDSDGVTDLIVGSRASDAAPGSPWGEGAAFVISGRTGAILRALSRPEPWGDLAYFGYTVGAAGDADGDGVPDVAVSDARPTARVRVYSGATGAQIREYVSPNPEVSSGFGGAVTTLGDLDGDGRSDLVVAALGEDVDGVISAGRVHVFSGMPVAGEDAPPTTLALAVAVAPNPARSSATLALRLAEAASVRVAVVDALGRVVRRLDAGALAPGAHRLALGVDGLPPGVYVVRVTAGDGAASARLVVAR